MKLLVPCFVVLALAACGSSSTTTTSSSGTGTTGGTTSGGKSGSSTGGGATGSAAGSTTGAPDTLGSSCILDASTGADPCGSVGLECSDQTGAAGTCILPGNISICIQDAGFGCQDGGSTVWTDAGIATDAGIDVDAGVAVDAELNSDGGTIVNVVWVDAGPFQVAATLWVDAGFEYDSLVCAGTFTNGTDTNLDLCLQPCTETFPECPIVFTNCLTTATPAGCFFNICQTQNPFDTCDATSTGANDGQCYQYFNPTTQVLTQDVCFQNGTAKNGETCDPNVRIGTDSQCEYSSFCMPNAADDGGICFPITADAGSCADTEVAIEAAPSIFGNANFGICVQDCSTGQTCTVGTCQAQTTGSVCLP